MLRNIPFEGNLFICSTRAVGADRWPLGKTTSKRGNRTPALSHHPLPRGFRELRHSQKRVAQHGWASRMNEWAFSCRTSPFFSLSIDPFPARDLTRSSWEFLLRTRFFGNFLTQNSTSTVHSPNYASVYLAERVFTYTLLYFCCKLVHPVWLDKAQIGPDGGLKIATEFW